MADETYREKIREAVSPERQESTEAPEAGTQRVVDRLEAAIWPEKGLEVRREMKRQEIREEADNERK